MTKTLPILYKKTNTGAIQMWKISTIPQHISCGEASIIVTEHGQVNGKIQTTHDLIGEGKNTGKKNATNAYQQAEAEALAKWQKQKKKGYVESIEAAEAGELDDLIEGGIEPMLAHSFKKQGHKIKYPCYVQPKLDGIRCIAILKNGKCTLWSRTRKPITGVPHIAREIEQSFKEDIVLDGELYQHDFKSDFEKIVSFVRQDEPAEGHEVVQYHVYDLIMPGSFKDRFGKLAFETLMRKKEFKYLHAVQTVMVLEEEQVTIWFKEFKDQGYEGCMLRNEDGQYVNKRSYDLQKVKEFDDAEFDISGIEEGRGKLAGHVGSFICKTRDGKEFLAKMSGDTSRLQEYFINHSLWKGKKLTVQYQGLTGANGVPRFPVGIAIRDYE